MLSGGEEEEVDGLALAEIPRANVLTSFRGAGKYDISRQYLDIAHGNATSRAFLYTPIANEGGAKQWPAVVFGHGLCAPADFYEHLTTMVASYVRVCPKKRTKGVWRRQP